jgi:hypothetical protein
MFYIIIHKEKLRNLWKSEYISRNVGRRSVSVLFDILSPIAFLNIIALFVARYNIEYFVNHKSNSTDGVNIFLALANSSLDCSPPPNFSKMSI